MNSGAAQILRRWEIRRAFILDGDSASPAAATAAVDAAAVLQLVADWAEAGNTEQIPAAKLQLAGQAATDAVAREAAAAAFARATLAASTASTAEEAAADAQNTANAATTPAEVAAQIAAHRAQPNAHHVPPEGGGEGGGEGLTQAQVAALISAHAGQSDAHHTPPDPSPPSIYLGAYDNLSATERAALELGNVVLRHNRFWIVHDRTLARQHGPLGAEPDGWRAIDGQYRGTASTNARIYDTSDHTLVGGDLYFCTGGGSYSAAQITSSANWKNLTAGSAADAMRYRGPYAAGSNYQTSHVCTTVDGPFLLFWICFNPQNANIFEPSLSLAPEVSGWELLTEESHYRGGHTGREFVLPRWGHTA